MNSNKILCIITTIVLISGCSSFIMPNLAKLQMQQKKLDNGKEVNINVNVEPTDEWSCKVISEKQGYNWRDLETKGQFTYLQGGRGLLIEKAIEYANINNLAINYINLEIPDEDTTTIGHGGFSIGIHNNYNENAYANFYQCKQINPENKLSITKSRSDDIRINE